MGDVLVRFNQASSDTQSWTNLKERHLGWSQESKGLWFKRADGSEFGDPVFIPSSIGQGMGRRVAQVGHGFLKTSLVRHDGTAWVLAQATADAATLASHMVVRVVDPNIFEVASFGSWSLGTVPVGRLFLSTTPGQMTTVEPTDVLVQQVATADGVSFHLSFGAVASAALDIDQLVEDLNDRSDLYANPRGEAGGDLLGQFPNPVVQKLTGLSVKWESMAPKWADTGLPFIPAVWILAAAHAPGTQKAMLVDNDGNVYFSETGGYTWRAAGYSVGDNIRDIAYGKISGTTYGWCVVGNYDYQWINDVPGNFVGGVPLQSAWNSANLADFFTDICYCDALETWFFQSQSPGLYYGSSLPLPATPSTVIPQGADDNTGGVFYERSTGRVVYFERGTGRVWWAGAGFDLATGWTEVKLGGVPVLKAITPAMSDSNGYGAGVSTNTIVAFVGGQGVVSTTSVADPTKYTQSIGAGVLPSFWDVASNGTDLIGSTVAKVDPVLYKIFVTLGEIPSEQRIVGKKGFLSKGPLILEGKENAEVLGTDQWGAVVKKSVVSLFGDLDYIGFDTTPESVPAVVGTVSWNPDEETLDIQQPFGVTLQVGQELQIHVVNKSGTTIPNGKAVYISGAQGNRPTVALAEADVPTHAKVIAVSTMDIANNAEGFVTVMGLVRQLNTEAFEEGDELFLSDTAGELTKVAPAVAIRVGYVVRKHATVGAIFVAVDKSTASSSDGTAKVTAGGAAGYLQDKITTAPGSMVTVSVVDDKLVFDATEDGLSDPVMLTTSLLTENGDTAFTGSCWSTVEADGAWGGFGQNTSDKYFKLLPLSRGTVSKATVYVSQITSVDAFYGDGNFGAIRIGLFTEGGVLKGQTAWVRGITAIGKLTLDLVAEPGQNLTIERNTMYWIGIIGRALNLVALTKASSALNLTTLRHAVYIRAASNGAAWSSMTVSGSGYVANSVPVVMLSAN